MSFLRNLILLSLLLYSPVSWASRLLPNGIYSICNVQDPSRCMQIKDNAHHQTVLAKIARSPKAIPNTKLWQLSWVETYQRYHIQNLAFPHRCLELTAKDAERYIRTRKHSFLRTHACHAKLKDQMWEIIRPLAGAPFFHIRNYHHAQCVTSPIDIPARKDQLDSRNCAAFKSHLWLFRRFK